MIAMIKSFSRRPGHVLAALALLAAAPLRAQDFDYYVLALSWSPTWCAGDPDRRSSEQCEPSRDLGFTLHGLWPQYDAGGWPEDCHSPERDATRGQTAAMADIMGTGGLAWYQWKKHGRCSGLSAGDYFDTARLAYTLLSLPEPRGEITAAELERDFIAAQSRSRRRRGHRHLSRRPGPGGAHLPHHRPRPAGLFARRARRRLPLARPARRPRSALSVRPRRYTRPAPDNRSSARNPTRRPARRNAAARTASSASRHNKASRPAAR